MNLFVLLFLGHLLGDFIFQPSSLIQWKYKEWRGVAFHAFIHFISMLLLVWVFFNDSFLILPLIIVALLHFFIDIAKIMGEKKKIHRYFTLFTLDQLAHFLTLVLCSVLFAFSHTLPRISPHAFVLLGGVCGFIIATVGIEMAFFQFAREKDRNALFKPEYRAIFLRALIFTITFWAIRLTIGL